MSAALGMFAYAQALGEDRRATPRDDITSALMHAEVDGERLTPQEFGSFFILLVVAGNETTRNAISHGMKALTDHPEQREVWWSRLRGARTTAVDEIVRWATPVIHFRRTATDDTVLSGQAIEAGDKVVLWYKLGQPRRDACSTTRTAFDVRRARSSRSRSASAPAARTSASAPTSPGARSP